MAELIKHENPVLIGLSFGGIVAQEIAALRKVEKLILISTVKSRTELPWYFRLADRGNLINWLPDAVFTKPNILIAFAFSLTRKQDKALLNSCFERMSKQHLKWAVKQILNWQGAEYDSSVTSITCANDRIFTANRESGNFIVNGGHFAIFTKSKAMQKELNKAFS